MSKPNNSSLHCQSEKLDFAEFGVLFRVSSLNVINTVLDYKAKGLFILYLGFIMGK